VGKLNDLTGQKFGRWTVIAKANDYIDANGYKHRQWLCKCQCGNEKVVLEQSLKQYKSKSCGCLMKEINKIRMKKNGAVYSRKDLTGNIFGKLTVIRQTGNISQDGCVEYECQCSCGKIKVLSGKHLADGSTTSCGCAKVENGSKMATLNNIGLSGCYKGTRINNLISKKPANNTSGYKGVWWSKKNGKWVAEIKLQGKKYYLGSFNNIRDAIKARQQAEEELFKPIIAEYQSSKGGDA